MGGLPFRVLEGFGVFSLAVLAACGGRSSTLEDDALTAAEANQPSGGSSGAASNGAGGTAAHGNVGNSGPATGGKGGSPTAGAAGAAASSGTPSGGASYGGVAGVGTGGATPSGGASSGGAAGIGTAGAAPSGGASSGGAAGVGTAGASSGGAAGVGAAGGASSGGAAGAGSSFYGSCANYCTVTSHGPCPNSLSRDECAWSCIREVSQQSPACQSNANALLDCLSTAYQNSTSCSQFDELAYAKCSAFSATYQRCAKSSGSHPPEPEPEPTCTSSGNITSNSCSLNMKCTNGAYYSVSCAQTSAATSDCTCVATLPGGASSSAGFGLNESTTFACSDGLATCGFPQIGAQ